MRSSLTRLIIIFVFVTAPFSVSALTNAEAQARILVLLQQVYQLQALLSQLGGTTTGTTTPGGSVSTMCISINRYLTIGAEGSDVSELQRALAADVSLYPEAMVSGYYGTLTEAAVKRFQVRAGIVSNGTPATTGYGAVEPRTQAALRAGCSGTKGDTAIARALVLTPTVGQTPLQVTATFALNGSSCSSYWLDWGDDSTPFSFDAGSAACSADIVHKEIKHTYKDSGLFTVTFRAGHVPISYRAPIVSQQEVSVGITQQGSFSLSPTSGVAPLLVNASFPINGSSCTSYAVSWGDGQTSQYEASSFGDCTTDVGTKSLSHTYAQTGTYTVSLKTGRAPLSQLSVQEQWMVTVSANNANSAIAFSETQGEAPLSVRVALRGYGKSCTSYKLDWGDGSSPQTFDAGGNASCGSEWFEQVFIHTYTVKGTYTITTRLGQGALNTLADSRQTVSVTPVQAPVCSIGNSTVCGQKNNTCPSGYICQPVTVTYPTMCALEDDGATLVKNGSCN